MNTHSKIRELRKKQGLTQDNLAEMLGVTKSAICRYEKNERDINLGTLKKIAKALNVPVCKILDIDNNISNEIYFNAIKENNYNPITNPLTTTYILDSELVQYFKAITSELGIYDYLRLNDKELLKIIKSPEHKTMLEVLYKNATRNTSPTSR